jgi:hypothetical protein
MNSDLAAMLDTAEKEIEPASPCSALEAERIDTIIQWVREQAPPLVAAQIQPIRGSMNRRFKRDVYNL